MPTDLYEPRGAHPPPPFGIPIYTFRSIASPGYLIGDIAFANSVVYEWDGDSWNVLTVGAGGGSGDVQVFSGNYAGGTPTDVPTTDAAVAFDTSNDAEWHFYGGTWH